MANTAVLDTFDLAALPPAEAKFLIQAYDATTYEGLKVFKSKNPLGDIISISKSGITSVIARLAFDNHLDPDEVINRLRQLASLATGENITISLDQATLDSVIAAGDVHLEKLKNIDKQSAARFEALELRLQKIDNLAQRTRRAQSGITETNAETSETVSRSVNEALTELPPEEATAIQARFRQLDTFHKITAHLETAQINAEQETPSVQDRQVAQDQIQAQLVHDSGGSLDPKTAAGLASQIVSKTISPAPTPTATAVFPKPATLAATTLQQLTEIAHSYNLPPSGLEQIAAPVTASLEDAKTATSTSQYESATQKLEDTLAPFIPNKENLRAVATDLARRASIPTIGQAPPASFPKITEALALTGIPETQTEPLSQRLAIPTHQEALTQAFQEVRAAQNETPANRQAAATKLNATVTQIVGSDLQINAPILTAALLTQASPSLSKALEIAAATPPGSTEHQIAQQNITQNIAQYFPLSGSNNAHIIAADLIERSKTVSTAASLTPETKVTPPEPTSRPSAPEIVTAQTITSRFEPSTPPIYPETITTQVVTQSIQETLSQLPLSNQQKSDLDTVLKTNDTVIHLVTQIHHPDYLVPGQTITEVEVSKLRDQIYSQLEHDFEGKLSPPALVILTDIVVGQALPVAKIAAELQSAQKSGAALLASENLPTFTAEVTNVQNQIDQIYRVLPQKEAEEVINSVLKGVAIPEDKKNLVNLKDLEIQIRQGLHPNTIRVLQSGLTAEGLTDAIQKEILSPSFTSARNQARNAENGASAAGALPKKPDFQRLSPVKGISFENGRVRLSLVTAGDQPSSLWLSLRKRLTPLNKGEEASPHQITSVPSSPGQSPFSLFSQKGFRQTRGRLEGAHKLLTSSQGRFALRLQQSPIGRLYKRITNFIQGQIVNKFSSWAGKQTIVIAAKSAIGFISQQAILATAKATVVKTAAKEILKKLAIKASTTILTRLGIEAVAGATVAPVVGWVALLVDLGWQLLKNVIFNPKFWKKLFNWLSDRPWVLAAMLAAPLFLGAPGFILTGIGALGLIGIAAAGGTLALAGMAGTLGAGLLGFAGLIFAPIILPIVIIVLVFLGSWLFLTIFYLLFILPQGFMTNQSARQISLIATESPVYLSLTKSASPRNLTNDQITQIKTDPQTITYTLSFIPDKDTSLQDIRASETTELIIIHDNDKIDHKDLQITDTWTSKISTSIPSGSPTSITYTLTLDDKFLRQNSLKPDDLKDSLISNTITLELTAKSGPDTLQGLVRTAQAVVVIGNPKVTSPAGWPIWGSASCVTQGPNAPFSHRGIQAIDIAQPAGQQVVVTHPGTISWWWDPYDGNSVIVTSPDKLYSTLYAHLDRRTPVGQVDYRGTVGYTTTNMRNGFMTGPHLHYQLRGSPLNGPDINKYLDPPAPIPSAVMSNCTYQGKDFHVTQP